jgi:hypothetical protein
MSVEKQLIVHSLSVKGRLLPMDVVNIIKDYAFDDPVTSYTKASMRGVVKMFSCAISRLNNCGGERFSETSENWEFRVRGIPGGVFLTGMNCRLCGNYLVSLDHRVLCRCIEQNGYPYDVDMMSDISDE